MTAINRLSTYLVSEVSTATVADTLLVETVRLVRTGHAMLFLPDDDGGLSLAGRGSRGGPGTWAVRRGRGRLGLAHNQALGLPDCGKDDEPPPRPATPDDRPRKSRRSTASGTVRAPADGREHVGVLYVEAAGAAHRPRRSPPCCDSLANLTAAFLEGSASRRR